MNNLRRDFRLSMSYKFSSLWYSITTVLSNPLFYIIQKEKIATKIIVNKDSY